MGRKGKATARSGWQLKLENGQKLDINRLARGGFLRSGAVSGLAEHRLGVEGRAEYVLTPTSNALDGADYTALDCRGGTARMTPIGAVEGAPLNYIWLDRCSVSETAAFQMLINYNY